MARINNEMKKALEGMMAEKIAIDNFELDMDLYDSIQFEDDDFPHKNRRRGKKFNKSSWCRKEHKKNLHQFDWRWGLNWWQPVDTGRLKNPSDPRRGIKVRLEGKKECWDAIHEKEIMNVADISFETLEGVKTKDSINKVTPPITENLGSKVWDAWIDYGFYVTMEAAGEFDKIAKSLKRLSNLNDTLQNDKLEQNICNLWDVFRNNNKF